MNFNMDIDHNQFVIVILVRHLTDPFLPVQKAVGKYVNKIVV